MNKRHVIATALLVLPFAAFAGGKDMSTAEKIKAMDTDADGRVSAAEFTAHGKTAADFRMVDANADGFATAAEMDAHWKKKDMDHGGMSHKDGMKHDPAKPMPEAKPAARP